MSLYPERSGAAAAARRSDLFNINSRLSANRFFPTIVDLEFGRNSDRSFLINKPSRVDLVHFNKRIGGRNNGREFSDVIHRP